MLNRVPPFVLLTVATILWGGNFVFGRAVSSDLSPFTLAFLRWVVALIIFFPLAWKSLKQDWPKIRQHLFIVFIMALTGVAAFNTIVYIGLHYTTAINASLVNSTTPIIIYVLSFFFLKERLTKWQVIGTTISLLGVLLIISKGSFKSLLELSFNLGDLIVLTAALSWSIYSLLVKHYSNELPGQSTFLINIMIGTAILLPFFIYELMNPNLTIVWSATSISAILYTGIFASIVSFVCWNVGVVCLGANKAGIYLNLIPVFATLFAILFIGEALQIFQLIGGLFVICGVFLSTGQQRLSRTKSIQ